jgi:hypothetical protein
MPSDPGRPASAEHLPYFSRYIDLVPDALEGGIVTHLAREFAATSAVLSQLSSEQAQQRYQADKWSVLEVLSHLSDTERVFSYRALHCARHDQSPLPGFDQDAWAAYSSVEGRDLASLLTEWQHVRAAALDLFAYLAPAAWLYQTTVSNHVMTARACAYIIAGHELHHKKLLQAQYGIVF